MKIVAFTLDYHPHKGGIQEYCHSICMNLSMRHEVSLVVPSDCTMRGDAEYEIIVDNNCDRKFLWNDEAIERKFDKKISKMIIKADAIIFFHCYYYIPKSYYFGILNSIKSIVIVYGTEILSLAGSRLAGKIVDDWRFLFVPNYIRLSAEGRIVEKALQGVTHIGAISDYTKRLSDRVLGKTSRMKSHIVGCGIDTNLLDRYEEYRAKNLHCRFKFNNKFPVVSSIARFVSSKNQQTLLRLAREREVNVILAGDGPERDSVIQSAYSMGVLDRILFPGVVSDEEKYYIMANSILHILLSKKTQTGQIEGFGITTLEAAAMNTASIVSGIGGIPFAVGGQEGAWVIDPSNFNELLSSFDDALSNNELRLSKVNFLKRLIKSHHNWRHVSRNIESLILR